MKKLALFLFLLVAVPAHAASIWLGTPFLHNGATYVPVMGNNLPSDFGGFGNVNLITTGTVELNAVEPWSNTLSTVWPNSGGTVLPVPFTSVYYDDIGLGYPEWYLGCGYQGCAAQPSGMLGAFPVVGSGTVQMSDVYGTGWDCQYQDEPLYVSGNVVTVGQSGGGGGGGGGHEEGVMVGEPTAPKAPAKARTTWGRIKALYR